MVIRSKWQERAQNLEEGSSIIQATIVLLLMFIVFFGVLNIGLTYYSMATIQTQLQGAIARADVTRVVTATEGAAADAAFKEEILRNSGAIVADNLVVQNTKIIPTEESPIIEVNKVRKTSSNTWADTDSKIMYVREDANVETEITYYVPMLANVPMMGQAVLHQTYRGTQCVKTRIEIFK